MKWPRRGGRSTLYAWMLANHEAFGRELAKKRASGDVPDWNWMADHFTHKMGLTNRDHGPVTAAVAVKTWQRVRRDLAQVQTIRHSGASPLDCMTGPSTPIPTIAPVPYQPVLSPDSPPPAPERRTEPHRPSRLTLRPAVFNDPDTTRK